MIELYHEWNSVHSFKVRIVLAEKGLEWVDRAGALLRFEHLRPGYLKLNPKGVAPTLVHEGRAIPESSVICEYLDDAFGEPPLRPADAWARAQERLWLRYHDEVAHPALRKASYQLLFKPFLRLYSSAELEEKLRLHPDPGRVALAYALSAPALMGRRTTRRRGFPNLNKAVAKALGEKAFRADRGHFLGHASGGELDINLFPHRRELNRGWSQEGRRFRTMERYVSENLGSFFYHRAVYDDETWIPDVLEYGVLRGDSHWWVDTFTNK